jgi:hypothetical protein
MESSRRVRFNRVYFSIFKAKVWSILIFEWILLLEIQKKKNQKPKIGFGLEGKFWLGYQSVHTWATA